MIESQFPMETHTPPYRNRLTSRAFQEFKLVWTSYRYLITVAAPIANLLILVSRNGWRSLLNATDVVVNAVVGVAVATLGSYVISIVRALRLLDADWQTEVAGKDKYIAGLETRISELTAPKHPPGLENRVRELVDQHPQSRKALELLMIQEEIAEHSFIAAEGAAAVIASGILARRETWTRPGVMRGPYMLSISGMYKPVVRDVLYS